MTRRRNDDHLGPAGNTATALYPPLTTAGPSSSLSLGRRAAGAA